MMMMMMMMMNHDDDDHQQVHSNDFEKLMHGATLANSAMITAKHTVPVYAFPAILAMAGPDMQATCMWSRQGIACKASTSHGTRGRLRS